MINEATEKVIREQKSKLMLAESIDEIKDIITKAGGEISSEDAEHLWNEIKHMKESRGQEIDDDEMDAVAGGADRNWIIDGCAATCEHESWCFSNDFCLEFSVTYFNFWTDSPTCPDGTPHDFGEVYYIRNTRKHQKKRACKKCGLIIDA